MLKMNKREKEEIIAVLLIIAVMSLFFLGIAILEVETDTISACRILCGVSFFSWVLAACILTISGYDGSKLGIPLTTVLSAIIFGISLFSRHFLYSRYFIILPAGQIFLLMSYIFEFVRFNRQ